MLPLFLELLSMLSELLMPPKLLMSSESCVLGGGLG